MKAVVQHGYGPPDRVLALEDVAVPAVGEGEVLVRVRATGVNTPDWLTVGGVPRILRLQAGLRQPKAPVRGSDVAGTVAAVGPGVRDLRPGDEVFGSLWTKSIAAGAGTFAEFTLAPATQLVRKPAGLSFEEAGASVMSGLTALLAVRDVGRVGPGSRVLVNGASGGVGTFAVQIAKRLGAHVTGVCGPGNVEMVRSLGADDVIDHTVEDYTRGPQRFDVVLDNVLNHPPAATIAVLRPGGTFIPNSAGEAKGLLGGLPRVVRAKLARPRTATVRSVECDVTRENLDALSALLASGEVKVIIERSYPLADAAGAVAHMATRRARGNIAITVR
ncbi:NAD(P)-dependent alcohol dehydrogenase [Pseudonocardia sp. S2-4]|uniref:NAD(P)-dependent alcohol dehydrogenase n=2 Tax=Pseudonocardia humida TaxID=2800819 RepID=A0ABT1A8H7_9PSEU|nr:NAD(P)-dependent alcohol dehydrogenase [Pseudonocardia humida]